MEIKNNMDKTDMLDFVGQVMNNLVNRERIFQQ
jgi:hypothetical protein